MILPSAQSFSVAEASRLLGVSIPTLKAMCSRGELACFKTPGGHLRVSAEALAAIRSDGRARSSSSMPSGVLQARRERVEELNLESQELRAQRELSKLRREQAQEVERYAAEQSAREAEREEGRERSRAARERQENEAAAERAEQQRTQLRHRFLALIAAESPTILPAERREQLLDALEEEFIRRGVQDESDVVLAAAVVIPRLIRSWQTDDLDALKQQWAAKRRDDALQSALGTVRIAQGSTPADVAEASAVAREALTRLSSAVSAAEIKTAADAAVAPIMEKIDRRREREELVNRGVAEVFPYLERLHRAGGISRETLMDACLRREVEEAVRRRLSGLLAAESSAAVRRLVHKVVDAVLDHRQ